MSLLRLLTAGKSLVGLKESTDRYRVSSQRLLPKFEPKKNPFGASAQRQAAPLEKVSEPANAQAAPKRDPKTPVSAPRKERLHVQPLLYHRENISACVGRWCSSVLGFLFSWVRRRSGQPAARRAPNGMFQGELSLEAVKVVRNDLSESDVEIAPAKAAAAGDRAAALESRPVGQPVPTRWAKVANRLFVAAKH